MEFETIYLGIPMEHDYDTCQALHEYDETIDDLIYVARSNGHPFSPRNYMEKIAMKYNTTVEEMKKHWNCIRNHQRQEGMRY